MESFLASLGEEIQDVDEEVFDLFTHSRSSQDLGMVDATAEELEISVCGRDFTIRQSPGVLQSKRSGGTTGAAVWRVCVHFSEWLGSPKNPLFGEGVLTDSSTLIELGSGISGLVPSILSPRVGRVIPTDQQYAVKLLQENIQANQPRLKPKKTGNKAINLHKTAANIEALALDWEEDDIRDFLRSNSLENGLDAIIICDCIFNYTLIQPLVETCIQLCKPRSSAEVSIEMPTRPTLCVIAQQLRQPDIFESWLRSFMEAFHVWRLTGRMVTPALDESSGFVVHVAILRSTAS